jgi:hypothetical protein
MPRERRRQSFESKLWFERLPQARCQPRIHPCASLWTTLWSYSTPTSLARSSSLDVVCSERVADTDLEAGLISPGVWREERPRT